MWFVELLPGRDLLRRILCLGALTLHQLYVSLLNQRDLRVWILRASLETLGPLLPQRHLQTPILPAIVFEAACVRRADVAHLEHFLRWHFHVLLDSSCLLLVLEEAMLVCSRGIK